MKAELANTPLDRLNKMIFTKAEYEKVTMDDGEEVKVNGRMYDVARVEVQRDFVIVYALHDESEDNLISFVDTILKRCHQDKKGAPGQLLKLFSLQYLPSLFKMTTPSSQQAVAVTSINFSYHSFEPRLHTPPPRS